MNQQNRLTTCILGSLLAFSIAESASAATLIFTQDEEILLDGVGIGVNYTDTNDAEIREDQPDTNFDLGTGSSSNPEFTVDLQDPDEAQALIRFDNIFGNGSGQIPLGSTILLAELFIDIDNTGDDLNLLDLSIDFGDESTVTWNSVGGGITDGVNGSFNQVIDGGGDKVFIDVTTSLANWSLGNPNNGWAFLSTGNNGVDFDASENSDPLDRPTLFVAFEPIPFELETNLGLVVAGGVIGGLKLRKKRQLAKLKKSDN